MKKKKRVNYGMQVVSNVAIVTIKKQKIWFPRSRKVTTLTVLVVEKGELLLLK